MNEETNEELEPESINYTELEKHEYFMESVDSARKIGSISLDSSEWSQFGDVSMEHFHYLANQLKDSNIENISLKDLIYDDDQLTAISTVLKHTKIKNLNLESNAFGKNGILALTSALKESQIENLKLFNNKPLESDTIHILINSLPLSNITTLNLGTIDINFRCLKHLANTFENTKIIVLGLRRCGLNDKGIKYLSKKLNNSKIQSLNLSENKMSFDSLQSLADILENTAITELYIFSNKIGSAGAQYLSEKLSKSVVQNLDIGDCMIESEGCLAIGNVIHLTQIIKLNLEKNKIDSSGITSLAENLTKSNVKNLNLDKNNLQINGAQILAHGMKDSKLEYLDVDSNKLSTFGVGIILDALQFTKISDFHLNCWSNDMKKENVKSVTNAFQFFKLKNLNLILPKNEYTVLTFFNELKTLIESHDLDEILSIKNKMNFSVVLGPQYLALYNSKYIFDVIKHFYMKKLLLNYCYFLDDRWIPSLVEMLIETRNPISNITALSLIGNYLRDAGAIILAENFKYLKLKRLELDDNDIKNDGVIAIAKELKNSQIRYLSLARNPFNSIAASYLTNVVEKHPVRIHLDYRYKNHFSVKEQLVLKNINYMYLKAQLLVRSVSDNSPVKYDKDIIEHLKAYEIFKNVDLLWKSIDEIEYDYNRINSQIRYNVTKNFLKIIGVVDSDEINSDLLPTEIIIKICSYLKVNDIKFN